LQNIGRATAWIKQNTQPQGSVAISYFCLNPDAFYTWLRSLEVPVPLSVFDGANTWCGGAIVPRYVEGQGMRVQRRRMSSR